MGFVTLTSSTNTGTSVGADFSGISEKKKDWENEIYLSKLIIEGCPLCVVANVLDCDIVVSEFELQSCYYFPFQTNTLAKDMNSLIPPYIY